MSSLINWEVARGRAEELRGIGLEPQRPRPPRRFRAGKSMTEVERQQAASGCGPSAP